MQAGAAGKIYIPWSDGYMTDEDHSYRNFLMSCAALMDQPYQPMYFPLLDGPIPPGIRNLQKWIEEAWAKGTLSIMIV